MFVRLQFDVMLEYLRRRLLCVLLVRRRGKVRMLQVLIGEKSCPLLVDEFARPR